MWTFVAGADNLQDLEWSLRRGFLLTNGLGGYCSSSLVGCNTRRYHGLLVAALNPPLDRYVLLSHLDEMLVLPSGEHYLNTTEYRDGFFPDGNRRLLDFRLDPLPVWRWQVGETVVTKRVLMVYRTNCVMIQYQVTGAPAGAKLVLAPFVAMRSFHELKGRRDGLNVEPADAGWRVSGVGGQDLFIRAGGAEIMVEPIWYKGICYRVETERGQDDVEDLLRVGSATVDLDARQEVVLTASLGADEPALTFAAACQGELARRRELVRLAGPRGQREEMLVIAADQFLVERPSRERTLASILAGYPWFADWGRDAMVALPGLCLATGRHDLARAVLELFAGLIDEGMMPNRFEDDNKKLSYNSVDSSLWFIQAARAYGQATGDLDFVHDKLWKPILEIVRRYHSGTRHHIHADTDGLIWAGEDGHALTWMDAMHGGVPFTQRRGKAVEINALWLSALGIVADWGEKWATKAKLPEAVRGRARTTAAFGETFWNAEGGYLYDCVDGKNRDVRVRPNQLFAVSLPFAPVTGERARAVVGTVRRKLLTPCGLRTLAREDRDYRGRCIGNWFERDFAYHQGTVWPWLLGPYVDALMASAESEFVAHGEAQGVIDNALATLDQGTLGTVAEIFDGDEPHWPRGCFAQAWSVAEILRVKRAYDL